MLDAAQEIVARDGPDALTVEAVVTLANTSVGSFYARFGDRHGLIAAMQDRFLTRILDELAHALDHTPPSKSLDEVVLRIIERVHGAFRIRQDAVTAFFVESRGDPAMRARGAQASQTGQRLFSSVLSRFAEEIPGDFVIRVDFAYRMMLAAMIQELLFEEVRDDIFNRDQQLALMLVTYLRNPSL
jgi:AcrR family transcriptional regulator